MGTPTQRHEIHLPTATIVRACVAALVVWALVKLWPELVAVFIAVLLAIALEPFVALLVRWRLTRATAVALLAVVLVGLIGGAVAFVLPPLAEQTVALVSDFASFRERVAGRLSPEDQLTRTIVDQIFLLPQSPEVAEHFDRPLVLGQLAASGAFTTVFVLVTTLYLLLDGRRLYAWLLAYVPRHHREKMARTVPEVSRVVCAYVRGQLLTSAMFAVFCAVVLKLLGVPAVLPLALLAGLCDVIPVVGIILATLPAAVLGLTVSPGTALAVIGLYGVYHLFEAYFIVPRVYGNSLRLSTLAVLLALLVGGTLQGIVGAVLVLPIVAAYPIIERIWLEDYLAPEVLADHEALEASPDAEHVVDAVLQGEEAAPLEQDIAAPAPVRRAR